MGHRADLIVLRNGKWKLYYDHWCASRIEIELFWGPEVAIAFIEQREAREDNTQINWGGAQGGVIVDLDLRVLLFYGGEDIGLNVSQRNAYILLMQQNWPNWTIEWAHQGVVDLGNYLGIPRDSYFKKGKPEPWDVFRISDGDENHLFTWMKDGRYGSIALSGWPSALLVGPAHLQTFTQAPALTDLNWTGEMPLSGCHMDFDTMTVHIWCGLAFPDLIDGMAANWQGWSINWLQDDYRRHIELSGAPIRLTEVSLAELQANEITRIQKLAIRTAAIPAVEIVQHLLSEEVAGKFELSSATEEFRGSIISPEVMHARLDDLVTRLPIVAR
jgi:hypothetical protein